jgi:predicted PurR-regulated permease PerM
VEAKQKFIIFYTLLGAIMGFLSNLFDVSLSILLAAIIFSTTAFPLIRRVKERRRAREITYSALITFVLLWLMVWIFIYNLHY